ncbi:unnamed protein product [Linum trigynum]|uniref:Uncharacterized protein n=1 Tax=Linum trigynum TaxID=586398 RepID=A0AAV2FZ61_9ROSI
MSIEMLRAEKAGEDEAPSLGQGKQKNPDPQIKELNRRAAGLDTAIHPPSATKMQNNHLGRTKGKTSESIHHTS